MKRAARIFSALALYALTLAVAALIWLRPAPPEAPQVPLVAVERIVVEKAARRLTVYQDGQPVRQFRVALGFSPRGNKARQGDGRTPEGLFHIDRRNAGSAYHLSLGLDYPRPADRTRAAAAGVDPGGDIMIHGQPNRMPAGTVIARDWTAGCIALSDAEMEAIFAATALGTPVEVRP
jgi:murein L,D-transpeptidase YafK